MHSILGKGIIRGGQVVVDIPIDLPDGSEVTISKQGNATILRKPEIDQPPTPEETAATLAAMDKVEPFV